MKLLITTDLSNITLKHEKNADYMPVNEKNKTVYETATRLSQLD